MNFSDVVRYFGTVAKAAEQLSKLDMHITRQAIYLWRKNGIPHDRQKLIELATKGELKASE